MKKLNLSLVILVLMALVLTACGTKDEGGASDGDKLKVVAIVNGTLGDKSFYDSLNEGLEKIKKEKGIVTKVVETGFDETKWEPAVIDASEEDWDIIITGTWQMADYVSKVAADFPDKKYIVFDTAVDYSDGKNKNVYSIEYKQNEGSYLAGAVAAKMSETGKLGFVGGVDIAVINDFLVGFIAGAQATEPNIKVASSYIGNFEDAAVGKELAFAQFGLGVDIVFPAAAVAGNGSLEAAKERGLHGIGVDSDQSVLFDAANDEAMANAIYTSVLKEVGNSIVRALELELEGKLPLGTREVLGIKEGSIGIAKNKFYETNVPKDVQDLVDELEEKIKSGELEVPTAFGLSTEALNKLKNSVKP